MERRKVMVAGIPCVGAIVVLSLLYLWLAPNVECKWIVYGFGMGLILTQSTLTMVLWRRAEHTKALAAAVAGTAFMLAVLLTGGALLALDAPGRMTVYLLTVLVLLYLVAVGSLTCGAAEHRVDREAAAGESVPLRRRLQNRFRAALERFRRRPGETDAQRQARILRDRTGEQRVQLTPPPLPERRR